MHVPRFLARAYRARLAWRAARGWAIVAAMGADSGLGWTDFGARRVRAAEKPALVRGLFDSVAGRYDLMNDLMSGGVHRLWRRAMIDWLAPEGRAHIVDVAGGTGDIAARIHARTRGATTITVCDASPAMLEIGRERALDRGRLRGIEWLCGDAEALPIGDGAADGYTIAFGIRNLTDIPRALAEARRVLRPGGRFLCLEFSRFAWPGPDALYDAYSFNVVPWIGEMVTGNGDAYRYLVESIRRFPDQRRFASMIAAAGLERVRFRNLSGGIAALHSAWRI